MNIVVLGYTGMLGHQVAEEFKEADISFKGVAAKDFDLSDENTIRFFADYNLTKDDLVINCCGLLRQRIAAKPSPDEIKKAFMLNSFLPHFLSTRCKLVQVGSDCVFFGSKGKYNEQDLPDAEDIYGRSKAMGEPFQDALVIRTSIVGKETHRNLGLYEWFMKQTECNGFSNHFWNGVTTNQLAKCLVKIVRDKMYTQPGLYHLFSNTVSKYELLCLFNKYGKNNETKVNETTASISIDRTLSTVKPEFMSQFSIPSIEEQIREMHS